MDHVPVPLPDARLLRVSQEEEILQALVRHGEFPNAFEWGIFVQEVLDTYQPDAVAYDYYWADCYAIWRAQRLQALVFAADKVVVDNQ
jgi:hypothetical protein